MTFSKLFATEAKASNTPKVAARDLNMSQHLESELLRLT